jgi:hypothetical protein
MANIPANTPIDTHTQHLSHCAMGIERSTEPCVVFVLALKSRDPPTPFEVAGIAKGGKQVPAMDV